jgi:hypothetical protein
LENELKEIVKENKAEITLSVAAIKDQKTKDAADKAKTAAEAANPKSKGKYETIDDDTVEI